MFDRKDGGVVKTPYQAPVANCYAESWIGSLKRECLNHFACFGLGLLDHIVQTYGDHHKRFRPYQGLEHRLPGVKKDPSPQRAEVDPRSVHRREWLGGLLRHYERRAA